MLDWNEQQEVGVIDTIWSKLDEDDHIVPYPTDSEDDNIFASEGSRKKQMVEQNSIDLRVTEQPRSGSKDVFPFTDMEPCSNPPTRFNVDSAPNFDDNWRSFGNSEGSTSVVATNQFTGAPEMLRQGPNFTTELCHSAYGLEERETSSNKELCSFSVDDMMELHSKSGMSFYGDNHGDSFLDYDWASITNFDDLDGMFSNDSAFGREAIDMVDELLSPTDSFNTTMPPFPSLGGDTSEGHRTDSEMAVDSTISGDQTKLLQCRTNLEKNYDSQHITRKWSQHHNQGRQPERHVSVLQPFQSETVHHQEHSGDSKYESCIPSNHHEFIEHGCLEPSQSPLHTARKQPQLLPVGNKEYSDYSRKSHSLQKPGDMLSTIPTMTPQEKLENLRHKQMKVELPTKKQHKKFGQLMAKNGMAFCHRPLETNQSQGPCVDNINTEESVRTGLSELVVPVEKGDLCNISDMSDRTSLAQTVYYELQNAITQLDDNLRIAIRDSLFRLAQSAMERSSASDRSSNNINSMDEDEISVNVEETHEDRLSRMAGAETGTNPVDRIVAHLLFDSPHQSFC